MKYLILTMLLGLNAYGLGGSKPWYSGPADRRSTLQGWVNTINSCAGTRFSVKSVEIDYTKRAAQKTFDGRNLVEVQEDYFAEAILKVSGKKYSFVVVFDDEMEADTATHFSEGHLVAYMMARFMTLPIEALQNCVSKTRKNWAVFVNDANELIVDNSVKLSDIPTPPPPSQVCGSDGSKRHLIKPVSETTGNLVLLFSCEWLRNVQSVTVKGESGRNGTDYTRLPNGKREHWRFSRSGPSYGNAEIVLTLKTGQKFCHTGNMGTRAEGFTMRTCGGTTPTPTPNPTGKFRIDTGANGSITLSPELESILFRAPKLIYNDGPNQGDGIPDNGRPFENYVKSGNSWVLPSGTSNFQGRHGILFNTKPGTINLSDVVWPSSIKRKPSRVERDPSGQWDTWGGHFNY